VVPSCFVCRKPVDAMSKSKLALDDCCEFTVWCHGERETIRVPANLLAGRTTTIEFAEAFRPAGLLEAVPL
jgi:hypothetical protein